MIKKLLDVDVDGLEGTVKYTISEMYDVIDDEGYSDISFELIDEFIMTFGEISEMERIQGHSMKEEIYKKYGIS